MIRLHHTHQVIELSPIAMDVTHWVLHQGWCPDCGRRRKAQVPVEQALGYGPRFSALMGGARGDIRERLTDGANVLCLGAARAYQYSYGVYQTWVECRQTCLAHLIRTAQSLAERQHPDLAACGT